MSDSASSSGGSGTFSPLSAASSRTSMDEGEMLEEKDKHTPAGHGSSLWSSITGVASNLTISVSKALATNVAAYSGEGAFFSAPHLHLTAAVIHGDVIFQLRPWEESLALRAR